MNQYYILCEDSFIEAENENDAILKLAELLAEHNNDLSAVFKAVEEEVDDNGNNVIHTTLNNIACADDRTNYEAVGEVMAGLLMDQDVTTYDMWEEISTAYQTAESESFRRGMDKMAQILLWKNVNEIAIKICKEVNI